jgi:hypothetical protein
MQQARVGQRAVGSGRVRRRLIVPGGKDDQRPQAAPVRDAELLLWPHFAESDVRTITANDT